jgi:hypothetical protein
LGVDERMPPMKEPIHLPDNLKKTNTMANGRYSIKREISICAPARTKNAARTIGS